MRGKRYILFLLAAVLLPTAIGGWIYAHRDGFTGSRIRNGEAYRLEFSYLQGPECHTLHLVAGNALQVEGSVEKGTVAVSIGMEGREPIYTSSGLETPASFQLEIPETGDYVLSLRGKRAAGVLSFAVICTADGTDTGGGCLWKKQLYRQRKSGLSACRISPKNHEEVCFRNAGILFRVPRR